MALKTDTNSSENLVINGEFSNFMENGQILLLNQPLMIYAQNNVDNNCAIVLDPISDQSSQNLNLPEIIFDGNYYQFENLQTNNFPNEFGLRENYDCVDEGQQVDDGLAVLEILCNNNNILDQPEFVDVKNLTVTNQSQSIKENENDVLTISDDDDVVFVQEYKDEADQESKEVVENNVKAKKSLGAIRRNPVRKVRVKSRDLSKEHIFEEDFAFLDTSEEEPGTPEKENKTPNRKPASPKANLKQWPVNAHERPEYNTTTNKIEAFDYTIREIKKKTPNKKPKLDKVPVQKKPKKKYVTKKRKPRVVEVKKIPISSLKPLVNSTFDMLQEFVLNVKESRSLVSPLVRNASVCNPRNLLEIFKNQCVLFSIVNDLNETEVLHKVNKNDFYSENTQK